MLINSDTLNIYFIYDFCSLEFSREAHLSFMSCLRISSYAAMPRSALVSHIHNTEHSIYSPQQHIMVMISIMQCPVAVFHVIPLRQAIPD